MNEAREIKKNTITDLTLKARWSTARRLPIELRLDKPFTIMKVSIRPPWYPTTRNLSNRVVHYTNSTVNPYQFCV